MLTIPAEPPTRAPCGLALLGEAPAEIEELLGRPFVGRSGKLLGRMLRLAGIEREECWVGNVFDERLPGDELGPWLVGARERAGWEVYDLPPIGGRFLRPEHAHHLRRLGEELAQAAPKVIVAFGDTALWALTGLSGITAHRGTVVAGAGTGASSGWKVVPTFHLAFVLRQYQSFPLVVMDLLRAKEEVGRRGVAYTRRWLVLQPSLADLRRFRDLALRAEMIAVDIETMPTFRVVTVVGMALGPEFAIAVPFVDWARPGRSYWPSVEQEVEAWELVREVLESPVPKVGQNFTYDWRWLWDRGIGVRGYRHDTRLMAHALWPELPKDLGTLGSLWARERGWKAGRMEAGKRDE